VVVCYDPNVSHGLSVSLTMWFISSLAPSPYKPVFKGEFYP